MLDLNIDMSQGKPQEYLPTGLLSLDKWLGSGLPKGKISIIWGPSQTFKSTISLMIAREVVNLGGRVFWIDTENWFQTDYAETMNFNVHATDDDNESLFNLLESQTAESLMQAVNVIVASDLATLIVVDSLAFMTPQNILDSNMNEITIAQQARLMTTWMSILTSKIQGKNVAILFVNQVRTQIGAYGAPPGMPGGLALRFAAGLIIKSVNANEKVPGTREITLRIDKNKVSGTRKGSEIILSLIDNKGEWVVDLSTEVFNMAISTGILLDKSGALWSKNVGYFEEIPLGNGRAQILTRLDDEPELRNRILLAAQSATRIEITPNEKEETQDE